MADRHPCGHLIQFKLLLANPRLGTCARNDANRSRSLILRLWRYELPTRRSLLVSRPSCAGLLRAARSTARWAAIFVVSERTEPLLIRFSALGGGRRRNACKSRFPQKLNLWAYQNALLKHWNILLTNFDFPINKSTLSLELVEDLTFFRLHRARNYL